MSFELFRPVLWPANDTRPATNQTTNKDRLALNWEFSSQRWNYWDPKRDFSLS